MEKCNQCRNAWEKRKVGRPKQCPRCKRQDWDEPKKSRSGRKKKVYVMGKDTRRKGGSNYVPQKSRAGVVSGKTGRPELSSRVAKGKSVDEVDTVGVR